MLLSPSAAKTVSSRITDSEEKSYPDGSPIVKLSWKTVVVDVLFDRVYSRVLNTFIFYLSVWYLFVLYYNEIIPPYEGEWNTYFGSVITYILYIIYAFMAAGINMVAMASNGVKGANSPFRVAVLVLHLICSIIAFITNWLYTFHGNKDFFAILAILFPLLGCFACFVQLAYTALTVDSSYFERTVDINTKYVKNLLSTPKIEPEESSEIDDKKSEKSSFYAKKDEIMQETFGIHPSFQLENETVRSRQHNAFIAARHAFIVQGLEAPEAERKIPKEQNLTEFFSKTSYIAIFHDVINNTPQLLLLGWLLGFTTIFLFLALVPDYAFITSTFEDFLDLLGVNYEDLDYVEEQIANITVTADSLNSYDFDRNFNSSQYNETELSINFNTIVSQLGYNFTYDDFVDYTDTVKQLETELSDLVIYVNETIIVNFRETEDNVNYFFDTGKDAWNLSVQISLGISTVLCILALCWPLVVAVNVRNNLRTGLWRYNREAYVPSYNRYTLAAIPGNMMGVVLIGFTIIALCLTICIFIVAFEPLGSYLWEIFDAPLFACCFGIVVKMIVVYLLFVAFLKDKNGDIETVQGYSFAFCIYLFFNLLYGTLSAVYRLLYFIIYTIFALIRMDVTLLPLPFWGYDAAFSSFSSYMLYEHETKNPILTMAVRHLAQGLDVRGSDGNKSIRARVRWHLAYTLLNNPSLIKHRRRKCKEVDAVDVDPEIKENVLKSDGDIELVNTVTEGKA